MTHSAKPDDDWAPLPAETVATQESRKADREQKKQIAVPAPAVRPVGKHKPASAEVTASAPNVELAEVALLQLRERIAKQQKSDTPVQQAFRKASKRPEQVLVEEAVAQPRVLAPSIESSADHSDRIAFDDRDARQDMPWFRALPHHEQARLIKQWQTEREQFAHLGNERRRHVLIASMHGAFMSSVLVLVTEVGFMVREGNLGAFGWRLPLVVAGAIAAGCSHAVGGGAWTFAFAGLLAYIAVLGDAILLSPNMLFVCLLTTSLFGLLGLEREMLQRGGFLGLRRLAARATRNVDESNGAPAAPKDAPTARS